MTRYIDPADLRPLLLIDTDKGPRSLRDVIEPWQAADFAAIDPAIRVAMGDASAGAKMRALLKRPRGHSKTADVGLMAFCALVGCPKQISGVAVAASKDQALFIRNAIERLVKLNRRLANEVTDQRDGRKRPFIDVQSDTVRNTTTGSTLSILSADVASSWGINCQLILADEICHWSDGRGEDLWISLLSAANKRSDCALIIITNAFLNAGRGWQWRIQAEALRDPNWHVSSLPGPTASWITPQQIDEMRRFMPLKRFRRLVMNEDIADAGDVLDSRDVEAAVTADGPHARPILPFYIAGVDIGIKNDHSAVVTLGLDLVNQTIHLADCCWWNPADYGGEVPISEVEDKILDLRNRLGISAVITDPWEARYLNQRLRARGIAPIEWTSSPGNLDRMATAIVSAFRNGQVVLYRDEALIRDFNALSIIERPAGLRLQAPRTRRDGHADRGFAFCIALPTALAWLTELLDPRFHVGEPIISNIFDDAISWECW